MPGGDRLELVGVSYRLWNRISAACVLLTLEYVEYTDGPIAPTSGVNANPPAARTASSQVQRTPGRIADYDPPLSEVRPSPYSARQAGATTVIYTSDKGPGEFSSIFLYRVIRFPPRLFWGEKLQLWKARAGILISNYILLILVKS